jgi:hypothetical protein
MVKEPGPGRLERKEKELSFDPHRSLKFILYQSILYQLKNEGKVM